MHDITVNCSYNNPLCELCSSVMLFLPKALLLFSLVAINEWLDVFRGIARAVSCLGRAPVLKHLNFQPLQAHCVDIISVRNTQPSDIGLGTIHHPSTRVLAMLLILPFIIFSVVACMGFSEYLSPSLSLLGIIIHLWWHATIRLHFDSQTALLKVIKPLTVMFREPSGLWDESETAKSYEIAFVGD